MTVGVKTISPCWFRSHRVHPGLANNGRRGHPGINFLQLSTAKKAIYLPSGDQKGNQRLLFRGAIEPEVNPRDESTKQICVGSCGRSDIDHIEAVWRDGKPFLVS